jgi:hypothetical protein
MPYFTLPSNKAILNNLGAHASSEYQARGINPGNRPLKSEALLLVFLPQVIRGGFCVTIATDANFNPENSQRSLTRSRWERALTVLITAILRYFYCTVLRKDPSYIDSNTHIPRIQLTQP